MQASLSETIDAVHIRTVPQQTIHDVVVGILRRNMQSCQEILVLHVQLRPFSYENLKHLLPFGEHRARHDMERRVSSEGMCKVHRLRGEEFFDADNITLTARVEQGNSFVFNCGWIEN